MKLLTGVSSFLMLFTTLAFTADVLIDEGFEGSWPPSGWGDYEVAAPGWAQYTASGNIYGFDPYNGTYMAGHDDDYINAYDYLTVDLDLTYVANTSLSFYQDVYYHYYYTYHGLKYSTTGEDPYSYTYTEIIEYDGDYATWTETTQDLSSFKGSHIWLAWHYQGNVADEWGLDTVYIEGDDYTSPIQSTSLGNIKASFQ